jgi:hypothetical protein
MELSNNNKHTTPADEKQCQNSNQIELDEETLASVQGGALNPAEVEHITHVATEAASHHGVGIGATALDYAVGAATDFGAFSAGEAIFGKKKKQS